MHRLPTPMPPRPYILNELTWKDVGDARYEVAVLPGGACEPHNRHLPYSTDNVETERIAGLAARIAWDRGARVVVLPVVPFGVNTGQLDLPLCLNMNPSTQALVLRDVATALGGQRVPKLVILNGHGGNDFRQMSRELSPATSEKGRRYVDAVSEKIAGFLVDLARADTQDLYG